jgi:hypothetical protein
LVLRAAQMATSDAVRAQNGPFLLGRALRSREHGPLVWAFVRDHWGDLHDRFSGSLMTRMLEGITWLVDDASVREIPEFLDAHPIPEGARVVSQHVERLQVHRRMLEANREALERRLRG